MRRGSYPGAPMEQTVKLLKEWGWPVLDVRENLIKLAVEYDAARRRAFVLRTRFQERGVMLWAKNELGRPFAWVEFDPVANTAVLFLVINDTVAGFPAQED